ncbi:cell adhesion molecule CEACAM21-like [Myotis yumanensis]|uniref:cell adhesion molecule CEACAM21-like n=1 Tax=Myotis yumanensis TaxID=159337 RepID=UPI0038D43BA4
MEFPAASASRGLVPWMGLLMAVFLLTLWIPPTTAQFETVMTSVLEGQDVTLRQYIKGRKYTGRETVKFDGSLVIRNITVWDLGIYTAVAVIDDSKIVKGFGRLNVYRPVSVPTLLASNTTVTENEDAVVMTCYTDEIFINWLFNATTLQLKERMKLSEDNTTLTIDPVRREDAGNYQCKVSNPINSTEIFLLNFWIPPTTAQFEIVMTSALEGQDVTLRTQNRPPDVTGFIWYRGLGQNYTNLISYKSWDPRIYITGPAYTGRETVKFDGSLVIRNITVWDLGIYTAVAVIDDSKIVKGFGRLNVYRPVSVPTLLASNTTVTENEDAVVMTCYTDEISIKWLFNATSLQLGRRMKLSEDNTTLTIDPVRREDAGNYQCKVSNPVSYSESAPVELYVKY